MNTEATPLPLVLRPGQAMTLPQRAEHELLVLQGRLWLTRSGDPDDHFLVAGQRFKLGRHERTVIEADGAMARCRVVPVQPAAASIQPALR